MIRTLLRNKQARWALGCTVLAFTIAVVMLVSTGRSSRMAPTVANKKVSLGVPGSKSALPANTVGNSRAIAQNVLAPVKTGNRMMWQAPTDVVGNKLDSSSDAYKQAILEGKKPKGYVGTLNSSAIVDLATLKAGDIIAVPLFEGKVVMGVVNLVQPGSNGIIRVGGGLTGNTVGSFGLAKVKGRVEGSVLLTKESVAYMISAKENEENSIFEVPLSDELCITYPEAAGEALQAALRAEPQATPPPYPSIIVPTLSSRPEATAVIFLDFDGATITDPLWNNGNTFVAPPYSLSVQEITEAWSRVKEDYLPFEVDITTNPARYDNAPVNLRTRVIITSNDTPLVGSGGVARLFSFSRAGTGIYSDTIPCFVFNSTPKTIGEAASHEVGHTLGLSHDGQVPDRPSDNKYYAGQGTGATSWAPIMGVGYDKQLTQWSKGEYLKANNTEDDLAIISGENNGFGYIPDDAEGDNLSTTLLKRNGDTIAQDGTISFTGERDFYAFSTEACTVNVTALAAAVGANLDIALRLVDSSGGVLAASNPVDDINATLTCKVPRGLYYIVVDGARKDYAIFDGYTNYGSLGAYKLSGTIPGETTIPTFLGLDDVSGVVGQDFSYQVAATSTTTYALNGAVPPGLSYNPRNGSISGTPTAAGNFALALQATNDVGTSYRRLLVRIASIPIPVVTNEIPDTGIVSTGIVGTAFEYQITASNNPTSFSAVGLPGGLVVNPATGVISGTPVNAGIFTVNLIATNSGGSGSQAVGIRIIASATNLSIAVEANGGIWSTGGAKPWRVATKAQAFDKMDAARSGVIGNDKESWMQADINGPATVSFRWAVDSEAAYDRLTFKIDNVQYASISGPSPAKTPKYRFRSFSIGSGPHSIRWTYKKDFIISQKLDAGFVDTVTIQPRSNL